MKQRTLLIALCSFLLMSFCVSKNAIKYEKGAVVNTTSIVKARGFRGKTPVKIYIRNGKVQKIVALPNQDTPSVFAQAETLLKKFVGKSIDEAEQMKVDGVSGATYSSKALIQNVKGGLKYYRDNKK